MQQQAKTYYDFLSKEEKRALADRINAGPTFDMEGVHPHATDQEVKVIGETRFFNAFYRDLHDCPKSILHEEMHYDRRSIAQRLADDGFAVSGGVR